MITEEQRIWLDHLSDTNKISIVPFDPTSEEKFLKLKIIIQAMLGSQQEVEHRGASSLGISGQDEIDIYVPVASEIFDSTLHRLIKVWGQPKSHYPLIRARFTTSIDNKHIDVFVINRSHDNWKNSERFHQHLLENPHMLKMYEKLKEQAQGESIRKYYEKKIEFINEILNISQGKIPGIPEKSQSND